MTHHKGPVSACQYLVGPNAGETTPAPEGIDRRLVVRYGVALLTGGYTAIPTYAWVYYARLGVSEAEMVLIAQLCTYWWTERAPHPGEAALAARMGKTVRTIQGYLRSLEAKGLLHIQTRLSTNGRQSTNAYDLRPFFAAVEGLARLDGLLPAADATPATPATSDNNSCRQPRRPDDNDPCKFWPCDHNDRTQGKAEREPLCAGATSFGTENRSTDDGADDPQRGEGSRAGGVKNLSPQVNPIEIESFDFDSIPPTPTNSYIKIETARTATYPEPPVPQPTRLIGKEGQPSVPAPDTRIPAPRLTAPKVKVDVLTARVRAIGQALGDEAPASSVTRARTLYDGAGETPVRFLALLDEAARRTQARQDRITRLQRTGDRPNAMPYLFAVLADLLDPAPARSRGVKPQRRRPSHRRWQEEYRTPTTAFDPDVSPASITESDPVWRAVLGELAGVLTVENFNRWFAPTRALSHQDGRLRVAVPSEGDKVWLECKLAGRVGAALAHIGELAVQIEYVVQGAA